MAWTAPMTFVANTALTAAQLNTHLRDNLFEMSTARASESGQFFVSLGRNKIVARKPVMDTVVTSETTGTNTEWVHLTTPGPTVTVETGTAAWIWFSADTSNATTGAARYVSFAISGATTRDTPAVATTLMHDGQQSGSQTLANGQCDYHGSLTPGINTFTLMYKAGNGTSTFSNRRLIVWPL